MTCWCGQCIPCCFSVVLRSVHRQTFETEIRLDTRQWCADGLDCHLKKLENKCCYSHYSLSSLKRLSREFDIYSLSYWLMRETKELKACGKKNMEKQVLTSCAVLLVSASDWEVLLLATGRAQHKPITHISFRPRIHPPMAKRVAAPLVASCCYLQCWVFF